MRKKMKFLGAVLLLLFTFEAVVKGQVMNPKAEIISSSEKVVKGAPFSAEAISESVQILFDGNRITQSVKNRLYRDGEGRFRRDEMPKPVGIGSFMDVPQMIFILDPVSSVKFYLNPESKTARQSGFKSENIKKQKQIEKSEWKIEKSEWEIQKAEQEIQNLESEIGKAEQEYQKARQELEKRKRDPEYQETEKDRLELAKRKKQIENRKAKIEVLKQKIRTRKRLIESPKEATKNPPTSVEKQSDRQTIKTVRQVESINESSSSSSSSSISQDGKPAKEASKAEIIKKETKTNQFKIAVNPNQPKNPTIPGLPKGEVKNEALGTRKIEGVEAEGVRLTTTVAAGAIGNERPIEIVYERWYSKELQLIVFSKYSDPRFGEQTYRLINIKRTEPDGTLFTLPADYKIVNNPENRITVPRKKAGRT